MNKLITILLLLLNSSICFCGEITHNTRSRILSYISNRNYDKAHEINTTNSHIETLITKYSQIYWTIYDEAMKSAHNREVVMGSKYYGIIEFIPDTNREHEGDITFLYLGKKHTVSTTKKSVKIVLNAVVESYIDTSLAGNYLMIGVHNLFDKSGDREYGIYILENTPDPQAQLILDYYKQHNKH